MNEKLKTGFAVLGLLAATGLVIYAVISEQTWGLVMTALIQMVGAA